MAANRGKGGGGQPGKGGGGQPGKGGGGPDRAKAEDLGLVKEKEAAARVPAGVAVDRGKAKVEAAVRGKVKVEAADPGRVRGEAADPGKVRVAKAAALRVDAAAAVRAAMVVGTRWRWYSGGRQWWWFWWAAQVVRAAQVVAVRVLAVREEVAAVALRRRYSSTRGPRAGVTLMELLLALGLSVLVLSAISMAISLHFKMLDVRRTNLEETTATRVLVKMMTDDIRRIVMPYQPDLAGLETVFQNTQSALQGQLNAATGGALGATTTGATAGGGGGGQGGQGGGGQGGGGQAQGGGQGQAGGQGGGGGPGGGGGQGGGGSGGQGGGQGAGGQSGQGGALAAVHPAEPAVPLQAAAVGGLVPPMPQQPTRPPRPRPPCSSSAPAPLRFDVSRLPRVDEFQAMLSASPNSPSPEHAQRCEDNRLLPAKRPGRHANSNA